LREYLRQGNSAAEGNGKAKECHCTEAVYHVAVRGEELGFSASVILAADEWFRAPAALLLGKDLFVPKEYKAG
jgi:hypothetical protein